MHKAVFTLTTPILDYGFIRVSGGPADETIRLHVDDEIENNACEMEVDEHELDDLIDILLEARRLKYGN